jgi:hypothetical protein
VWVAKPKVLQQIAADSEDKLIWAHLTESDPKIVSRIEKCGVALEARSKKERVGGSLGRIAYHGSARAN